MKTSRFGKASKVAAGQSGVSMDQESLFSRYDAGPDTLLAIIRGKCRIGFIGSRSCSPRLTAHVLLL